jgi:hypothetical protein
VSKLAREDYLAFPLRVGPAGPELSSRSRHIREQIEQVLLTNPGERVFRHEFGAGIRSLVFEPNTPGLHEVTKKRLLGSLAEALQGEVDPRSLEVYVEGEGETLTVVIRYMLATLGHTEGHRVVVGSAGV